MGTTMEVSFTRTRRMHSRAAARVRFFRKNSKTNSVTVMAGMSSSAIIAWV